MCRLFISFVLIAFEDNIVFFYSPTETLAKTIPENQLIRLGGLVKKGSVTKYANGQVVFSITDMKHSISTKFLGILPDLFREGQGVVAEGHLNNNIFTAKTILAKHDENYMPANVAAALKKSGKWQGPPK